MPTRFCPTCWAENAWGAEVCRQCGCPLGSSPEESYHAKLMQALQHPEPGTVAFAAHLLGQLGVQEARLPLLRLLEEGRDPAILQEAIWALGQLRACESVPILCSLLQRSYLLARLEAVQTLGRLATAGCSGAREALVQVSAEDSSVGRRAKEELDDARGK
jgi:HEAT repeat protein